MDALAHGAFESGVRPRADASVDIGSDVGREDRPERRFERSSAGVEGAVRAGMTDRAVDERCQLPAASDGCRGIDRGVRPRNRRDRSQRQHRGANADRGGTQRRSHRNNTAAPDKRALPLVGWSRRLGQGLRCRWRLATQSPKNSLRRKRELAKPDAGRVKDGIGDSGSTRNRSGFAYSQRRLVLTRQHQHVDLW